MHDLTVSYLQVNGVFASQSGQKAIAACWSGDVYLVERSQDAKWSGRSVVTLPASAVRALDLVRFVDGRFSVAQNHAVWNAKETMIAVACQDKQLHIYCDATVRR